MHKMSIQINYPGLKAFTGENNINIVVEQDFWDQIDTDLLRWDAIAEIINDQYGLTNELIKVEGDDLRDALTSGDLTYNVYRPKTVVRDDENNILPTEPSPRVQMTNEQEFLKWAETAQGELGGDCPDLHRR
ncbi:MAG: hypothetical protein WCO23_04100 [bacterium]